MAEQICPNCKNESFNYASGEINKPTIWYCYKCTFKAYEDESLERICLNCNTKSEINLMVNAQNYWWCSKCHKYELIKE